MSDSRQLVALTPLLRSVVICIPEAAARMPMYSADLQLTLLHHDLRRLPTANFSEDRKQFGIALSRTSRVMSFSFEREFGVDPDIACILFNISSFGERFGMDALRRTAELLRPVLQSRFCETYHRATVLTLTSSFALRSPEKSPCFFSPARQVALFGDAGAFHFQHDEDRDFNEYRHARVRPHRHSVSIECHEHIDRSGHELLAYEPMIGNTKITPIATELALSSSNSSPATAAPGENSSWWRPNEIGSKMMKAIATCGLFVTPKSNRRQDR